MTVYIVVADNNWTNQDNIQWNHAVCTSYEAAERCIQEARESYAEDMVRIRELEGMIQWREEERVEFVRLRDRWCWAKTCPTFGIEEHELIE